MIDDVEHAISGDEQGRSWFISTHDGVEDNAISRAIGTIIFLSNEEILEVLGSAFVVGYNGSVALCMCATHSLEHAFKDDDRMRHGSHWNPPIDEPEPYRYRDPKQIKVFFDIDGVAITCDIVSLNFISGNDVAIFLAKCPDESFKFRDKFALDLAVPRIGDEVAVAGNLIEFDRGPDGSYLVEQKLHMRHGLVSSIEFWRTMPGQHSVFYTTIPIPGGMSGSPVLLAPSNGKVAAVCGIVSSDLSSPEAYESQWIAGRSAISMLWPAYGLGILGISEPNGSARNFSLKDMLEIGFIENATSRATLKLSQNKNSSVIRYEDAIHGMFELKTTGNPNAQDTDPASEP